MKKWISKLLSDSKNLPSTRLHLAWGCFFLLCYAVYANKSEPVITAIIGGCILILLAIWIILSHYFGI